MVPLGCPLGIPIRIPSQWMDNYPDRGGYGLEVVLALAQQPKIGPDQVERGYTAAEGNGLEPLLQATVAIDDRAGHRQAGMGGVDFGVALLEDEGHRQFTLGVKS